MEERPELPLVHPKIITYENVAVAAKELAARCRKSRNDSDLRKKQDLYYSISVQIVSAIAEFYIVNKIKSYKHITKYRANRNSSHPKRQAERVNG